VRKKPAVVLWALYEEKNTRGLAVSDVAEFGSESV
jgi:hypothetical protein